MIIQQFTCDGAHEPGKVIRAHSEVPKENSSMLQQTGGNQRFIVHSPLDQADALNIWLDPQWQRTVLKQRRDSGQLRAAEFDSLTFEGSRARAGWLVVLVAHWSGAALCRLRRVNEFSLEIR